MSVEKIRGIVLKEYNTGENSKRIVVFSREKGKIVVSVNGAKNTKSKYLAATQLFCYSEFVIFEGKGFYSVTQAQVIESFYGMREDIGKLSYGAYILDLVEKTMLENMVDEAVFELLIRTFSKISKTDYSVLLATSVFEIKYLQIMGLFTEGKSCAKCGVELTHGVCFSTKMGVVCSECGKTSGAKNILGGTFAAIEHVLHNDGKTLFSFKVSREVENELRETMERYIVEHLEQRFSTLEFAKECVPN